MNTNDRAPVRLDRRGVLALGVAAGCAPWPVVAAPSPAPAGSGDTPWPYPVKVSEQMTLLVYPPQLETWDGGTLSAIAAVVAREGTGDKTRSTYGTVSIEAHTLVDKGNRRVTLDNFRISHAAFPTAGNEAQAWVDALQKDSAARTKTIPLDALEAQLHAEAAGRSAEKLPLRNDPPVVVFSRRPALLVTIDGAPHYGAVQGISMQRVINTRVLLARDTQGRHFLHVFDGWLTATSLESEWTVAPGESAELKTLREMAEKTRAADLLSGTTVAASGTAKSGEKPPSLKSGKVPAIVVAIRPSELIVSDGEWSWTPVAGTRLLYVSNTTGNIFRDTADQRVYLLLSGRWFRSDGDNGPWTYVAANALPEDFAKIPDDSAKENVKASVAGTPQANEAAIAASVPQTAAVRISQTKMQPLRFDGDAQWSSIAGTPLQYAVNTPTPVIRVDSRTFYAMENGVWFVATSTKGPWTVATSVPAVIYGIPPSAPLHYVTYVRIYGVQGDVVYEGYSAGYQGTYIDPVTGVVVYGTGYVYDPWIGTVWVGAPPTYGYATAVTYTPWTGWFFGFCFGWAWGAATSAWGWGWGPYPYWGPWGYGWGYWYGGVAYGPRGGAAAWGPGGWAGYSGPIYQRWGDTAAVSRFTGGFNAWTGNQWATRSGIAYNSRTGVTAAGQRGVVNNVYTGNFAAGSRGVVTGPGGVVAGGARGVAGNTITGNTVAGNKGFVYNPNTGNVTTFGGKRGQDGGVGHIGDDVYAGHDGNVYRNTGDGWQKHAEGGWQPVNPSGGATPATRPGEAGAGERQPSRLGENGAGQRNPELAQRPGGDAERFDVTHQLDHDRFNRQSGFDRADRFNGARGGMQRSFGGGRLGGGGFHGGFRR